MPEDFLLHTALACTDKTSKQYDLFYKTFSIDESDELEDLIGRSGWIFLTGGELSFIDNGKIDPRAYTLPFSYGYKFPKLEWD